MTFHIGQKVICIKAPGDQPGFTGIRTPKKHVIYSIRALCPNAACDAVLLHEIHNNLVVRFSGTNKYGEPSFASWFFRPLVDLHEVFSISTPAPKQKEFQNV